MKTKSLQAAWLLAGIAFVLFFGQSCKEENNPTPELVALQKTKRVTKSIYYNLDGSEARTSTDTSYYDSDTLINGETWYGSKGGVQFFRNGPEGLYAYLVPAQTSYLLYKYPASDGEYYSTKSFQGPSASNENQNPYNLTEYQMLVANTQASAQMRFTSNSYSGLMHYMKETFTNSTNGQISPAEWFILPGKGTVLFKAYYDNEHTQLQVYSETIAFL